jgi:hypothetical protein
MYFDVSIHYIHRTLCIHYIHYAYIMHTLCINMVYIIYIMYILHTLYTIMYIMYEYSRRRHNSVYIMQKACNLHYFNRKMIMLYRKNNHIGTMLLQIENVYKIWKATCLISIYPINLKLRVLVSNVTDDLHTISIFIWWGRVIGKRIETETRNGEWNCIFFNQKHIFSRTLLIIKITLIFENQLDKR